MTSSTTLDDLALDNQGYLLDSKSWSPCIAKQLAAQDNLLLTQEHWHIIKALRAFYAEYQLVPNNRVFLQLIRQAMTTEEQICNDWLVQLFNPISPVAQAARIAGLPKGRNCFEYQAKGAKKEPIN